MFILGLPNKESKFLSQYPNLGQLSDIKSIGYNEDILSLRERTLQCHSNYTQ